MDSPSDKPSLLERLSGILSREPEDRDELLAQLRSACERSVIDAEALSIIEGALQISEMQVRDVMIPRSQMDVIHLDDDLERMVRFIVNMGHSRFPVVGENKDDVEGIFLAKDLLRYYAGRDFDLKKTLRPAVFVPESKRLNVLLREFRISRNHMAIVVDEYGGVSGLVTIEDVLEQIVGDIEDEYDLDDGSDDIRLEGEGRYQVRATTEIADFNEAFSAHFSDDEVDTVGGLVIRHLGRMPARGDTVVLDGIRFQVLRADSRRIFSLRVEREPQQESVGD